ncbi:CTP-dependent riboflavin kinase [Acidianus sulfidivorans]|nr:CTP-dependent riboflavin kinase [Acidianus sulfidivorans]
MRLVKQNQIVTQQLLAKELNLSQQSVSRKLKDLESENLIIRIESKDGEIIKLTEDGENLLVKCLEDINEALNYQHEIKIKGRVTSGLGEGKIFLSIPYYVESFKKFLGFTPYPGTLNIVIYDKASFENRLLLDATKCITIPEYREEKRVLGAVKVFPATINQIQPAAIVIPLRTTHPKSVIEIVSPYYIREKLNLKDGDEVVIEALA